MGQHECQVGIDPAVHEPRAKSHKLYGDVYVAAMERRRHIESLANVIWYRFI